MLDRAVLLLNHNYEPLTTCSAKRAIIMVWSGKAEMVESTGQFVHSISMTVDIPSIIRLLIYVKITHIGAIQLTKQNIIKRDHGICQYCGTKEGPMTVDHVIPRSHGGGDTWENLVCACSRCNNSKGDRLLHEAGMSLIRAPFKPNVRSFVYYNKGTVHATWSAYIRIG